MRVGTFTDEEESKHFKIGWEGGRGDFGVCVVWGGGGQGIVHIPIHLPTPPPHLPPQKLPILVNSIY